MVIGFIPLRGGSKGIPFKNIRNFCGEPLCYWIIKEMCLSKDIDTIIVSTDSWIISNIISLFDIQNQDKIIIHHRSKDTAQDFSSTESVLLEVIYENISEDTIIVMTQATTPYTKHYHFSEAISLYERDSSVVSCSRSHRFIWDKEGNANYDFYNRPRRQDWDGILIENGAIFISSVADIKKSNNRISGKIKIYEMSDYFINEIDNYDDWNIAEYFMKRKVLWETK